MARGAQLYRWGLGLFLCGLLAFPAAWTGVRPFTIQDRTPVAPRPTELWPAVVSGQWQKYLESRLLERMTNVRAFLILAHNEAMLRLFPTRPNAFYVWAPEGGFYPVDTIRRLNSDWLHAQSVAAHYRSAAFRLRALQQLLQGRGVQLLVVVAPPKARVYPEYIARYLVAPPGAIVRESPSYAAALESQGVNVIDAQRLFWDSKTASPWPFFTTTGFHWSFWAGSGVAKLALERGGQLSGREYPRIDNSKVDFGRARWADTDIALILNVFSAQKLIGNAPFPEISPLPGESAQKPRLLVIGDSFSDQLVYAFMHALPPADWTPGWLVRYDGFLRRESALQDQTFSPKTPLRPESALGELLTFPLVILEVSDGNIPRAPEGLERMEHGATRALLDGLLDLAEAHPEAPAGFLGQGWSAQKQGGWTTSGGQASLLVRPSALRAEKQLLLDIEPKGPRRELELLVDGVPAGRVGFTGPGGSLAIPVPAAGDVVDSCVAELVLRSFDGSPLGFRLRGARLVRAHAPQTAGDAR